MSDWNDAEKHVERAHEHFEAGRWEQAEAELRQAILTNPYQAEWHFNLGLTLDAAGRSRDAISAFSEAFALGSEDPQAALLAGVNALRCDDPKLAIQWLDRAEKLDPESASAYVHRIEAFHRLGDHEAAETQFYLGQQVNADDPHLYCAMADSLLDRELFDRAIWCLREAARLDPEHPRVEARLADAYASTGRHERARQLYLRELRRNPGDLETLLDLGCLLGDMSRPVEAAEKFRRVLEIEPDNVDAQFALGDLAQRAGNLQQALRQYEVVLRLDPAYPEARRRVAALILNTHAGDDRTVVQRLLRNELRDVEARPFAFAVHDIEHLGLLLVDAGLCEEAIGVFKGLCAREPGVAEHQHQLALSLLEGGRVGEGIDAARRAVQMDPRHVKAMHNLALANLRLGHWLRSRYWVREGLRIAPEDLPLRRLRVRLRLRAAGDFARWTLRPVTRMVRWVRPAR